MIKADANRQNSTPGDLWEPPDDPGHAVREYLAVLDEAAFGGATQVVPKFIATADPAARDMTRCPMPLSNMPCRRSQGALSGHGLYAPPLYKLGEGFPSL